jgi:hypothetical protein
MNIARRIEAGAVCVNDHMIHMMIPEVPMGGTKESGLGRRHGREGIVKFCEQQTIVVDRFGGAKRAVLVSVVAEAQRLRHARAERPVPLGLAGQARRLTFGDAPALRRALDLSAARECLRKMAERPVRALRPSIIASTAASADSRGAVRAHG